MAETPRRWFSFIAYLMFVGVGVVTLVVPLTTLTSSVTLALTYGWSALITLGGGLGVWGIIRKSPLLEFYGLPLQFTCVALFGGTLIARGMSGHQWGALVVGMLMLSLSTKLVGRWWEIARLIRMIERRQDGSDD